MPGGEVPAPAAIEPAAEPVASVTSGATADVPSVPGLPSGAVDVSGLKTRSSKPALPSPSRPLRRPSRPSKCLLRPVADAAAVPLPMRPLRRVPRPTFRRCPACPAVLETVPNCPAVPKTRLDKPTVPPLRRQACQGSGATARLNKKELKKEALGRAEDQGLPRLFQLQRRAAQDAAASRAGHQSGRAGEGAAGEDRVRPAGDGRPSWSSCSCRPDILTLIICAAAPGFALSADPAGAGAGNPPRVDRSRGIARGGRVRQESPQPALAAAGAGPPRAGRRSRLQERLQAGGPGPVRQHAGPGGDLPDRQAGAGGRPAEGGRTGPQLRAVGGRHRQRHGLPPVRRFLRRDGRRRAPRSWAWPS